MESSLPTIMWPHYSEDVSITRAAELIERDRTALSRQIQKIHAGNPPKTRDPRIDIVARIFVKHAEGVNPAVKAALLIEALGIPDSQVQAPPPVLADKKVRHRISKKQRTQLRRKPAEDLESAFTETLGRVRRHNTMNARRWLKEIIDAMEARGIEFPVSQIDGIPPGRFVPFISLSDWAANAGASDTYLFFYRHGSGRPMDYRLLTLEDLHSSTFHFLTVDNWFSAMNHAMAQEAAEAERRLTDVPPKKKSKRMQAGKSPTKTL